MASLKTIHVASLLFALLAACSRSGDGDDAGGSAPPPGSNLDTPGSRPYDSAEFGCKSSKDCGPSEACVAGKCALDVCPSEVPKAPPMGKIFRLAADDELLFLGAESAEPYRAIDKGFRPDGSSVSLPKEAVDVAGGPVLSHRPNALLVADGTSTIRMLTQGQETRTLDVGFPATRVASGDMDGDGYHEVLAMGSRGSAVCSPKSGGGCVPIPLAALPGSSGTQGATAKGSDVTVGDVDGDGLDEAILIGTDGLIVWSKFHNKALRYPYVGGLDVAAGDLDGDGTDEVVISTGKQLEVVRVTASKLESVAKVDRTGVVDLAVMDLDADQHADVLVLTGADATVYTGSEAGLTEWYSAPIALAASFRRVAIMDADGDSAIGTYQYGPEAFPGPMVPATLLLYPPYWKTYQTDTAYVGFGTGESSTETKSESTTFSTSLMMGIEYQIPEIPIIKNLIGGPKLSVGLKETWKETQGRGFSVKTENYDRWILKADPVTQGPDNAGVVVGASCYAYYEYRLSDPFQKLGSREDDIMPIMVPLQSSTLVMSLKRYNAMAEAQGMPVMRVPYRVGDPTTYPEAPQTLAGDPIQPEDFIVKEVKFFEVGDVASLDWSRSLEQSSFTELKASTGLSKLLEVKDLNPFGGLLASSIGLGVGAAPTTSSKNGIRAALEKVSGGGAALTKKMLFSPTTVAATAAATFLGAKALAKYESEVTDELTYNLAFGKKSSFIGRIPNIPDRPETPEDETAVYRYEFAPVIYREWYTDVLGEKQSFVVVSYAVRFRK